VTIIIGLLLITLIFCLVRNIIKKRRRKALKKFEEASRG
jgi:septation ring formation regulator EzrA